MNRAKAINWKSWSLLLLPIEQDGSRNDPVKTEYGKDQCAALVEPDEGAVELRSYRFFADGSETLSGYFAR
ncbi:MAG: hypothetical protein K6E30_04975 [Lachnospiraceae bacterium]|nr:hypothetical protein [Lachnospiraceae bacterium]